MVKAGKLIKIVIWTGFALVGAALIMTACSDSYSLGSTDGTGGAYSPATLDNGQNAINAQATINMSNYNIKEATKAARATALVQTQSAQATEGQAQFMMALVATQAAGTQQADDAAFARDQKTADANAQMLAEQTRQAAGATAGVATVTSAAATAISDNATQVAIGLSVQHTQDVAQWQAYLAPIQALLSYLPTLLLYLVILLIIFLALSYVYILFMRMRTKQEGNVVIYFAGVWPWQWKPQIIDPSLMFDPVMQLDKDGVRTMGRAPTNELQDTVHSRKTNIEMMRAAPPGIQFTPPGQAEPEPYQPEIKVLSGPELQKSEVAGWVEEADQLLLEEG